MLLLLKATSDDISEFSGVNGITRLDFLAHTGFTISEK